MPPIEAVPASTQSDGKWRITTVPTGSNAKSVAILNGATAKPITYGLTADGWNHTKSQAQVEDKRLTLIQDLSRPGRITETLEIKAVESSATDSADAILSALATSGDEIQILVRRAVDNATTHTVGQIGDLLTGVVGVRRPQAPVENGVDTVAFTFYFTQPTQSQVTLVA
jgi:hypothetical protein